MEAWLILVVLLVNFSPRVTASGCQHPCDCGFTLTDDNVDDETAALRYEVLGGLCGAFSPILLAGLVYLVYKKCCSPCRSTPSSFGPRHSQGAPWEETNSGGNRGQGRPMPFPPGHGRPPRVSTPTSLYGEVDGEVTKGSLSHNTGGGNSQWVNIHRNVQKDETNVWFKNVNRMKQFY